MLAQEAQRRKAPLVKYILWTAMKLFYYPNGTEAWIKVCSYVHFGADRS